VQYAFKDLMIHEFCNSHYLSHFAAFFILARTKKSIVKSFSLFFDIFTSMDIDAIIDIISNIIRS